MTNEMTNEEAIDLLDNLIGMIEDNHNSDYDTAFKMAIKALETIPKYKDTYNKGWDDGAKATYEHLKMCEEETIGDLISRDAVWDVMQELWGTSGELIDRLMALPSVNPQEKAGHWEWVQYDYNPKIGNWHCSECRCIVVECVGKEDKGGIPLYKYCPQCGIKMTSQESEDV